jgi:hypothetical protein
MIYFILIALFCYILMQVIESASFASRLAGKLSNRLSLGTTLQNSIFVASRLFLPPLLLTLSFLIEFKNISLQLFILSSAILLIIAFFFSLLVLINFNYFQLFFQRLFIQFEFDTIPVAIVKILFGKTNKLNLISLEVTPRIRSLPVKNIAISAFAYFFLSVGFFIVFSFAILIPDYRMTLSQLATVAHGIGALILALYIDPMIGRSLDSQLQDSDWLENIYSIFVGRLLAYILASILFSAVYLYTYLV